MYFWVKPPAMNNTRMHTLIWLTIFSIAMGYLENAVVIYLREIYYPSGFDFPMVAMSGRMAITEIFREAATLVMLLSVAILAGKKFPDRFAWFLYCFAVWDIFYYVFLKLLIGWPESILTWDILFLIPMVWTGPVITPVVVSLTMILLAVLIIFGNVTHPHRRSYWLILSGAFIIFISFVWDFASFMIRQYPVSGLLNYDLNQEALMKYVPRNFNWWLFIIGELLIMSAIVTEFYRIRKNKI